MKRRKTERGQSLVELSVSLLVLLYLLSGAVELDLVPGCVRGADVGAGGRLVWIHGSSATH